MREPDIETEITLRSTEAGGQETPETRPREAASDSPGLDAGVSAISLDFAHRDPALKARLSRIYAAHRTLLLSIGGTSNMKAIVYYQYGSPDVLRLMEVDKPSVSDGGVLVRVRGAAANPYDWHFVRGEPYFMRLLFGLRAPKRNSLGVDFSGVVEAVAQGVTAFKLGDEVYGMCDSAFAEYLCAPETEIAQKPRTLGFDLAAAVPLAGLTALRGLRDCGQLRRGDRVLIIGASGGVGTFAVQLAKDFGGHVTGVCSMKNLEMVRSLGADEVIDYTQQDFAEAGQKYDLIFQLGGQHSPSHCRRALTPPGRLVLSSGDSKGTWIGPLDRTIKAAALSPFSARHWPRSP